YVISSPLSLFYSFIFNPTSPTQIYTLSLHDALPISLACVGGGELRGKTGAGFAGCVESALFFGRPLCARPSERERYNHGNHPPDAARGAQPALLSRRRDRQPQAPGRAEPGARGVLQP